MYDPNATFLQDIECHKKMVKEPIIVDNFLDTPTFVREIALMLEFKENFYEERGSRFPGMRTGKINSNTPIHEEINFKLRKLFNIDSDKEVDLNIYFHCHLDIPKRPWIHVDGYETQYIGLIYLHPEPKPNSGTFLYWPKEHTFVHSNNPDDFILDQEIENKFNRLICYDPMQYHRPGEPFGKSIEEGRLSLLYDFRVY